MPENGNARQQYVWYMVGVACFVIPGGIQTVLFPWLIAVQLKLQADLLGIAQMCMQLPALALILVGGLLADRIDGRKILMVLHAIAAVPAAILAVALHLGALDYLTMIVYAVATGTISAFINPARDGMLNRIAGRSLQRTVTVMMGLTWGAQIIGYAAASRADTDGAERLLVMQSLLMLMGAAAASRLQAAPPPRNDPSSKISGIRQIKDGLGMVFGSERMRPTMILLSSMSMFYGGSFVVLNPILVRDIYGGNSVEISMSFGAFVLGTITMTILLVLSGGMQRHGQGLVLALVAGGMCLLVAATHQRFEVYLSCLFAWGLCGAVAMSMSRTIMQEAAPEGYRSRVMSIFSLGNMGGMPLGALLMGFIATGLGPLIGLAIAAVAMMSIAAITAATTGIWRARQLP